MTEIIGVRYLRHGVMKPYHISDSPLKTNKKIIDKLYYLNSSLQINDDILKIIVKKTDLLGNDSDDIKLDINIKDNVIYFKRWSHIDESRLNESITEYGIEDSIKQRFDVLIPPQIRLDTGIILYDKNTIFEVVFFHTESARTRFINKYLKNKQPVDPIGKDPAHMKSTAADTGNKFVGEMVLQTISFGGKKKRSKKKRLKKKRSKKKRSKKKRH